MAGARRALRSGDGKKRRFLLAAEKSCSLVFLDPPYGGELAVTALTALREKGWLAPGALCIVETAKNEDFFSPPEFTPLKKRRSGTAQLHILRYMGTV